MPHTTNTQNLYNHVDFLTSLRPYRNYQNLGSLQQCVEYICEQFEGYGFTPRLQPWETRGNTYNNVIASYQPEKPKKLIVGAHYDVCGDQPGADDNASAVAGLLETARLIAENQPNLDYGIELVAYCLEEPPFFLTKSMGSYVHAQSLFDAQTDVLGMICYEMIGYFSEEPNSQPFPIPELAELYPSVGNFIIVVGIDEYQSFVNQVHQLMAKDANIDVQKISFPDADDLAGLSDHRNYWGFGYPALMINDTSFIRNDNYHKPSDTIDTLDFDKMTAVVDASYQAIVNLS